ncbi:nucleoside-diphosphate kinase [Marinithermus hydrothermalis]|uniref:Nucleoside diphosphate kinase n=1 Tax=Marinithermus hydrothermalis (strain DSM 14884 / JCM 11576 / T1) TaxID=869210 RepID=F2NRA6_MARHT|nr:nucleoside-diphosphate kinase [Marinithermus hydrothermalis]AEB12955.1 Nucleoside diphosphate kinase [Marinithermus hydrothermalis DSM 14884]
MERTFCMIKPDGVRRGLTGEILARLEKKGFRIVALKKMRIPRELAERHYAEHKEKPFFPGLVEFITSGPVVAMVLEGPGVIAELRKLMGATNPADALPGTIRGDYATTIDENVIHGSATPEDAEREIRLFFREDEIVG